VHRPRRLEGPIAVAEQHRGAVVAGIGEREILHEVAIEVAHRDGCRTMSRRVIFVSHETDRLRRHGRGAYLEEHERGKKTRYPREVLGHGDNSLLS
jgi:hypothetical protein